MVKRVQCPVATPLPQTPQSAEYMVMALVQQLADKGHRINLASDCQNVVRDCELPFRVVAGARRMHAGMTRVVLLDNNWRDYVTVRKVKAHVNPEHADTEELKQDAIGNNWADREAKKAVGLHPQPSPAMVTELEAALKRAKMVVRTIAAVTQVFPPLPRERMARPPAVREGATHSSAGGHSWIFANGLWRCRCCLKLTLDRQLSSHLITQECPGPKPSMQLDAMTARGHTLARTTSTVPIVFCTKCGAFTARRAYGLAARCRGTPTPAGAQALARIRKGQQPWQRPYETHRKKAHTSTEAWSHDRREFISQGLTSRRGRRRPGQQHGNELDGILAHDATAGGVNVGQGHGGQPRALTLLNNLRTRTASASDATRLTRTSWTQTDLGMIRYRATHDRRTYCIRMPHFCLTITYTTRLRMRTLSATVGSWTRIRVSMWHIPPADPPELRRSLHQVIAANESMAR